MPPPPPTTELIDDVTAEIFLRLPPDEPDHLFRAALVCKCKPWLRVLYDPSFLRRYRAYHGAPPLLGFIHMLQLVASGGGSVLRFSSHSPRLPSSGVRQRPPHAGLRLPPLPRPPPAGGRERGFPRLECRHR
ncbi:unnamed protein product [Urochloa humidicola]